MYYWPSTSWQLFCRHESVVLDQHSKVSRIERMSSNQDLLWRFDHDLRAGCRMVDFVLLFYICSGNPLAMVIFA